jgi:hypothetical protein
LPAKHIARQTSLEGGGFVQVTQEPGSQNPDLAKAQMIEVLDEILEVVEICIEDWTSSGSTAMRQPGAHVILGVAGKLNIKKKKRYKNLFFFLRYFGGFFSLI